MTINKSPISHNRDQNKINYSFHLLHLHSKMYGLNSFHPPKFNVYQNISIEYSDIFQPIFMIFLYLCSFYVHWTSDALSKVGSKSLIINYASRYFIFCRVFICIFSVYSDLRNANKIWQIIKNFSYFDEFVSDEKNIQKTFCFFNFNFYFFFRYS